MIPSNLFRIGSWIAVTALVGVASYLAYTDYSDQQQQQTTEMSGIAMSIPYRVVIGQSLTGAQQKEVEKIITNTFLDIDNRYNQWNPDSEISRLNSLRAGEEATLSPELANFLHLMDRLVHITERRFDPTIQPVTQLWMPHLEAGTVPSQQEVAALEPAVGWHLIHLEDQRFYKDHDATQLNFDAVAKGFGVDLIAHALSQAGYKSSFVEWGGEVKATGRHPEGRQWRVYITGTDNTAPENALAFVSLENSAIATSGDYYQQWNVVDDEDEPTTFCHVYDPRELSPLKVTSGSVCSVSVMTSSCAVADALATAAMVFPDTQKAQEWAESVKERYPSLTFWVAARE